MTENALKAIRIGMLNFDIIVESHCYVLIPKEEHMHPLVSAVALVLSAATSLCSQTGACAPPLVR